MKIVGFNLTPYFKTLLFLSGVGALSTLVSPIIGYRAVGYIFLLGVLAVGSVASIGPVFFAAFLSAMTWNFFFMPPRFTFLIAHPEDLILLFTFFVAALITGVLTNRIRKHQAIIQEREERLRQAEVLKESEKLHQTLLNSISHELRTPLTAIMGSATALSDENSPDTMEFRRAIASELSAASDRLNRVTENLLDMSRINSGVMKLKKEWHDVHDLIGVTLQRLGRNLDRHHVKLDVVADLPLIEIDFRLLEHVLTNILINAAQYSPPTSTICISAKAVGQELILSIEDEGPGIGESHAQKIFEKFYRVPGTPAGGTGLGLSIAKSIVELHCGLIRVETARERGTKFVISLPLGRPPEMPREKDATDIAHGGGIFDSDSTQAQPGIARFFRPGGCVWCQSIRTRPRT
ncbi:MAG: ATP-binding protein [Candidatus Altimarinota bacterium]